MLVDRIWRIVRVRQTLDGILSTYPAAFDEVLLSFIDHIMILPMWCWHTIIFAEGSVVVIALSMPFKLNNCQSVENLTKVSLLLVAIA